MIILFSSFSVGTIGQQPVGEWLDEAMVAGICTRYFTDHLIKPFKLNQCAEIYCTHCLQLSFVPGQVVHSKHV